MRIHICHKTEYRYDAPPGGVIQTLRLTPRNHEGQYVASWRVEVSADCRLHQQEDAFGNIIHAFTAEGPFTALTVLAEGEVETQATDGLVRGGVERFPPTLFLRETPLTRADAAITSFARTARTEGNKDTLAVLHLLLEGLGKEIAYDTDPTNPGTTAVEAFAMRRGVCQDLTHIFIAAARTLDIPARYVGGYFRREDGVIAGEAGHAWAEAFVPDLGWVAFDPTNGICTTEGHVRVAVGLDYLGASPVRGTRYGGGAEAMEVVTKVDQAGHQVQS
jgi:transglutaminase-like putative cysteine protease